MIPSGDSLLWQVETCDIFRVGGASEFLPRCTLCVARVIFRGALESEMSNALDTLEEYFHCNYLSANDKGKLKISPHLARSEASIDILFV